MFHQYGAVLVFAVVALGFVYASLIVLRFIRPHLPEPDKLAPYECGERSVGQAWVRFHVRFYIVAIIFIIFDLEIVLLLPWAVVYKTFGWVAFADILIFLGILGAGLAYVWRKGYLEWVRSEHEANETETSA